MSRRDRVRHRRRELLREAVWEAAQRIARGDMNTVERNEGQGYQGRDAIRFGPRISRRGNACSTCGLPTTVVPYTSRRRPFGSREREDMILPVGVCGFCSFEDIVLDIGPKLLARVEQRILDEEAERGYSELDTAEMLS